MFEPSPWRTQRVIRLRSERTGNRAGDRRVEDAVKYIRVVETLTIQINNMPQNPADYVWFRCSTTVFGPRPPRADFNILSFDFEKNARSKTGTRLLKEHTTRWVLTSVLASSARRTAETIREQNRTLTKSLKIYNIFIVVVGNYIKLMLLYDVFKRKIIFTWISYCFFPN